MEKSKSDLLFTIAHMYYGLGMTQEKIAKQLFFSRSRISHLLSEAEQEGFDVKTILRLGLLLRCGGIRIFCHGAGMKDLMREATRAVMEVVEVAMVAISTGLSFWVSDWSLSGTMISIPGSV